MVWMFDHFLQGLIIAACLLTNLFALPVFDDLFPKDEQMIRSEKSDSFCCKKAKIEIKMENNEIKEHLFGDINEKIENVKEDDANEGKINSKDYSEKERRKIVREFFQMKVKFVVDNKQLLSSKEMDEKMAQKFGIKAHTIYKWKKQFQYENFYSDKEKFEIVKMLIKMEIERSAEDVERTYTEICKEISDKFCVGVRTICEWRKKFGFETYKEVNGRKEKLEIKKKYKMLKEANPRIKFKEMVKELHIGKDRLTLLRKQIDPLSVKTARYSEVEKRELIQQFDEMIELSKCKNDRPISLEKSRQIAKRLGVCLTTIYHWKSEFGLQGTRGYKMKEKIKLLKKYYEMKRAAPTMTDDNICKKLHFGRSTLSLWKKELANGQIDMPSFYGCCPQTFADDKMWQWNNFTRKRN